MKTRAINRLYQGKIASIRDYEAQEAIKGGGLRLVYGGKTMTLSEDDLRRSFSCHKKTIQSKFNPNQTYTLIDFVFTPDEERKEKTTLTNLQIKLI